MGRVVINLDMSTGILVEGVAMVTVTNRKAGLPWLSSDMMTLVLVRLSVGVAGDSAGPGQSDSGSSGLRLGEPTADRRDN